jgi:hypothetical protein
MVLGVFQASSKRLKPQLSLRVMQVSQARPLGGRISCSGVAKSPSRPLRLLTMISGCSSKTIWFMRSDSHSAAVSGQVDVVPEHVDLAVVGHELADEAVGVLDKTLAGGFVGLAEWRRRDGASP